MITIYHNPRCSKSREALALVETAAARLGEPVDIVEYLKTPPTLSTLKQLHTMLGVPVREMVRANEAPYKELGLDDPGLTDAEVLGAVADNPILLQRPVVVRNRCAVIARPPENVAPLLA